MKTKLEKKLDEELAKMDARPRVYHFTENVKPFNAVTIAEIERGTWLEIKHILEFSLESINKLSYNIVINVTNLIGSEGE